MNETKTKQKKALKWEENLKKWKILIHCDSNEKWCENRSTLWKPNKKKIRKWKAKENEEKIH